MLLLIIQEWREWGGVEGDRQNTKLDIKKKLRSSKIKKKNFYWLYKTCKFVFSFGNIANIFRLVGFCVMLQKRIGNSLHFFERKKNHFKMFIFWRGIRLLHFES